MCSERGVCLNLGTSTTDALFADFADVLISCFIGFTLLIGQFGKLNHDILAITSIFGVELHDGVSGGSRAGEEIEDKGIHFCSHF